MICPDLDLLVCRILFSATLALSGAGCKSSHEGQGWLPPSGRPEVSLGVQNTAKQVQVIAQDFFRGRGYAEVESRHGYEFVFDKPMKSGRSGKALRVRLRLNKQLDGTWQFNGTPFRVEGWRSDLETEVLLPQASSQIQAFLVEIKCRLESAR